VESDRLEERFLCARRKEIAMVDSTDFRRFRIRLARRAAFWTVGLLLASGAAAVDGTVLAHGTAPFDLGGSLGDNAAGIAAQPDGKFVTVGTVATAAGAFSLALARFLPGGGLDPTFGTGGRVVNPFGFTASTTGNAVAVLPSGNIVVAGAYFYGNGDRDFLVGRLLPNGSPDAAFSFDGWTLVPFDAGGNNVDEARALTVTVGGAILVAGTAAVSTDDFEFAVARLNPNGDLDPTLDGDGRALVGIDLTIQSFDFANAVALDGSRIVLAGQTWNLNGNGILNWDIAIARLTWTGQLDPSFNGGLGRTGRVFDRGGDLADLAYGVEVDSSHRIVVAGSVTTGDLTKAWVVLRTLESGAPDPTFGQGGASAVLGHFQCGLEPGCVATEDVALALRVQGDGRIVLGGWGDVDHTPDPDNGDFGVARLLPDGAADASFGGGDGAATFDFARGPGGRRDSGAALTLAADGRIAVAGSSEWNALDTDFGFVLFDSSYIFADGFESGFPWNWSWIAG